MNPLLTFDDPEFKKLPFDKIKAEHFLPALKVAIEEAKKNIADYKSDPAYDFKAAIEKLETSSERVDYIVSLFYSLHHAHATKEMHDISEDFSQTLTQFSNDITLDKGVFEKVKRCYENRNAWNLTVEQSQVLDNYFKEFERNGALLDEKQKNELRGIDEKLSSLSLKFSKNVLDATNDYQLIVKNEKDLEGLPDMIKEAAKEEAKKKGIEDGWSFSLHFPSYFPFMTYAKNSKLREEIYMANAKKAYADKFDNQKVVLETIQLREKRAKLLGFKNHSDFVLKRRMASTPEQVFTFLNDLLIKALPAAKQEKARLEKLKKESEGGELKKWDTAYYSEILKKKELNFDDEYLRPYFKLENVVDGMFKVANKLYGISFDETKDIPKYHEDVRTFIVKDKTGDYLGTFYTDFFPRETKSGGAWMTNFFDQGLFQGKVHRPHVSIVCNFTKPTKTKPSLLTFNEVNTVFHEFGHALHGLLTKCTYRKLSGTSVYRDFVELPSQLMENWIHEKECLDLFAVHYETGEKIPSEYIEKIKKSKQFLQGLATIRQLSFSLVDMAWHSTPASEIKDVVEFEKKSMNKADIFEPVEGTCFSTAFSHIFAGGYSAGYYSYKWAEVLDADAFEYFQEKGIFNKDVAESFRVHILEQGGTQHPMNLYKKFRGKEPNVEPLLKRAGLV